MQSVRLYGLFALVNGKWERQYPSLAYRKPVAIRVFQSALLAGAMTGKEMRLRPVKES